MTQRQASTIAIGAFLIAYHVLLAICLPYYLYHYSPSWILWVGMAVVLYAGGLAITGGYHRCFSHKAYQSHPLVEAMWLFFGASAAQGSALKWSHDHRLHHAYVDTDRDPYSIKKGFWYAHCLWLFEDGEDIDNQRVADLVRNPRVMFQHRYSILCMLVANGACTLFFGWLTNDYFGAFTICFLLRLFLLHHFTWFINSAAHTWGAKPFSEEQSAVDNFLLSVFTFGEGYHNFHHTYANDYRNGIRWYHFDPTKWLIWSLSKLGLAYRLRRTTGLTIGQRIIRERKELLLEQVRHLYYVKRDVLEKYIQDAAAQMEAKLASFANMSASYQDYKKKHADKATLKNLRKEMKALNKSIKADFHRWKRFSREIRRMQPLKAWS